jgi:hypothetical protein
MSKAAAFVEDAKKAGWELADQQVADSTEIVTIENSAYGAVMVLVWENGRYIYAKSALQIGGHHRTIRNASEGRRFLAGVEAPKDTPRRPAKRRPIAPPAKPIRDESADADEDEPDDYDPYAPPEYARNLPFQVSSPSAEILAAVVGKEIVWVSSQTKNICSASTLPNPDQRQLRIEYNPAHKRILTFAARGEGFRSVYIESIIDVR